MIQEEDTSKFLDEATPWDCLTPSAQAYFGTTAQYQQRILNYFFDHQKPFEQTISFCSPKEYYQKLIEYGIDNFLVFPYHLISELQKFNPAVPFNYYIDMLLMVMANDRSYQSIPNFSAADALRVTGVGRNQFIDAMNKSRAGGWSSLLKSKERVLRSLLPYHPMKIPLQSWWILFSVPANENKLSKLQSSQRLAYERIAASKESGVECNQFAEADIRSLINEGLVYISVPLTSSATVKLLPLDNFVMNRVGGDYLEGLCYKSFISIDDRTTVEQLSKMLAVDVSEIEKVLSLFIRLGLAEKVSIDDSLEGSSLDTQSSQKRLAAVFDFNLPSALMLGNLGNKVKSFAVTLFEVGKMPDKSVSEFIDALQSVESPADESMVACHETCQVIARIGTFLREQSLSKGGIDMVRLENLLDLDDESRAKMFERNYAAAVALAPLTLTRSSLFIPGLVHFGPPSPLFHSPWALLYIHSIAGCGPPVFIWPQGEIVTALPDIFFFYETVRLFKWESEAVVVPTTTLLISLNDSLPSSPVLVQCYERTGEKMIDVAFPNSQINTQNNSHANQPNSQQDNLQSKEVKKCCNLDGLRRAFALDSMFGCMKFVESSDGHRAPIDVLYGMPTMSLALCNQVIEQIEQRNMFGEENIAAMLEDTKRISAELEEFVNQWSCNIGHPVRALYAIDGSLQWI
ncbi:hypothetical protein TRFO_31741 [Tritrichomonas foetus]|uniref:FAM91 N-terminal domain-containing protein n=1 Tax=Tritrichomonas foetus TaxID=1144522 RepID=A0A1J4JSM2_9EUKA|nr:hypothetical protein TRFO_31741 [Tritrichomonas foetus]|eukprot:OHT01424.1 hypothetical protein TRFO_31741 [Tritrichomonas foetus]